MDPRLTRRVVVISMVWTTAQILDIREFTESLEMGTDNMTTKQTAQLLNLKAHAHTIMSDRAADRLVARIDAALRTGVIDQQTLSSMELLGDDELA